MFNSQVPYEECACLDLLGEETHQGCVIKNVGQQWDVHARRGNVRQGRDSCAENRFLSLQLPQKSSWGFWSCLLIASFVCWVFSSEITSWEEKDISWSLRDTMQGSRKIQALQDCRINCSPKYLQIDTVWLDIISFRIGEDVRVHCVDIEALAMTWGISVKGSWFIGCDAFSSGRVEWDRRVPKEMHWWVCRAAFQSRL